MVAQVIPNHLVRVQVLGDLLMRIISKFHDYYDCIQRLGQDQTVVYLREEKELEFDWCFPKLLYWLTGYNDLVSVKIIGFCGKIYPLIELKTAIDMPIIRCWSLAHIDSFMQENLSGRALSCYRDSKWYRETFHYRKRKSFSQFFDQCRMEQNKYEYLFRENHSPLFIASRTDYKRKGKIIFNTTLKDVEFYSIIDNYTAFQEISMYLGGVLGSHGGHKTKYKGKPMSMEVSDKDLVSAKGFDKHSFRSSK